VKWSCAHKWFPLYLALFCHSTLYYLCLIVMEEPRSESPVTAAADAEEELHSLMMLAEGAHQCAESGKKGKFYVRLFDIAFCIFLYIF